MTQKANPSVNRPAGAFKTSGAIAYGGHGGTGFVKEGSDPTDISVQDSAIDETALNSFEQSSSASSLTVTIDPGEAFVFGSWICKDTESNVTLESDTIDQTVFVGWNKSGPNDVIVGRESAFSSAEGDTDEKISLFSFDTDSSGVTFVVDERSFDQISTDSIEQGSGSGLDSDTVDGQEASELDTNAGDNLSKNGSTLNVVDGSGSGLDSDTVDGQEASELDTKAGDNLSKNGSTLNVVDGSGSGLDSDTVDGIEASDLGSSVSDSGTSEEDPATTINFVGNLTATGDGTGEATVDIDEGSGSGLDADTVDGLEADSFVEESGDTMTGDLDMDGANTVTNLSEPSNNTDAATKQFTESVAQGLDIKEAVRVCTCGQGNIDLSSSTDPNPIDTVTLNDGDRILLIEQTDATENGIYEAVDADDPTTWVRTTDANDDVDVNSGMFVLSIGGSESGNVGFVLITPNPIDVGVTPLNFTRFSGAEAIEAGDNISRTGSRLDIVDGSGSGLDADTVDGNNAADFASDNHDNTQHSTNFLPESQKTSSASELTDVSPDSSSNAHHSRYTDSEASSAAPVQSVNGSTGDVTVQGIPSDSIIMWSGSINNIPSGWTLCDGTDGAPDLRNRFIAGAGDEYNIGDTGGEKQHQLSVGELPSHSHSFQQRQRSNNDLFQFNGDFAKQARGTNGETTGSTGSNQSHENRPRYYALAYIYKL